MSFASQVALQALDYEIVAVVVAVAGGYDYILTFSDEIKYIWMKPWGWVSVLFIIVRYFGLYNIIYNGLNGSSFLPGPVMNVTERPCLSNSCKVTNIVSVWTSVLFLGAADLVMILRVWVMYNRSRLILSTLLVLFFLEIVSLIVATAIDDDPKNSLIFVDHILNFSFCNLGDISPIWIEVATILQVVHGTAMCILAIIRCVKESLQMYHLRKQWQLNLYMDLLFKQGILYFVAMLLFQLFNALSALGKVPSTGWQMLLSRFVQLIPVYTLTPRFIISMRGLYSRHAQDRRGDGIDSAFGLSTSGSETAGTGSLVFADDESKEEETRMPTEVTEDVDEGA